MKKTFIIFAMSGLLTGETMAMGSKNDQAARGTTGTSARGTSSEESDSVGRGNSPSNTTGSTTQDADVNTTTNQADTDDSMTKDIEARKNDQDMSRRTSRNNTASGAVTPKSNY